MHSGIESDLPLANVRRRESFDGVADLYARARPAYPHKLMRELKDLTSVGQGQRVLEIGPGAGQLSVPLAATGASYLGIELGANLATILTRRLESFPHAHVVVADFDHWAGTGEVFDLIVAATSFHWLDPATRVRKCARMLRNGGRLAIIRTQWGAGARDDEFALASQACYVRFSADPDPSFRHTSEDVLPMTLSELEESGLFCSIIHRRYRVERRYTAAEYCDLLRTFSDVRAFADETRQRFLACIHGLIDEQFGGSILRRDLVGMWVAELEV
jgi:SAM-dependent methyltransferase